jgi:hypothetical protein
LTGLTSSQSGVDLTIVVRFFQHTIRNYPRRVKTIRRDTRTGVEVEAPEIVEEFAVDLTTEDVEAAPAHGNGVPIAASRRSAFGSYASPLPRAKIEKVETLILLVSLSGLGIATPDDEYTRYKCRSVSNSRKRDLSSCLYKRGGKVSSVEGVEVIFDGFADKAPKEEELACLGCY